VVAPPRAAYQRLAQSEKRKGGAGGVRGTGGCGVLGALLDMARIIMLVAIRQASARNTARQSQQCGKRKANILAWGEEKTDDPAMWKRDEGPGRQQAFHIVHAAHAGREEVCAAVR